MEHDLRLTVFWIVHLFLLGLFAIELAFVLSVWLKARVPGLPADASRWRKLGAALGFGFRLVFSRKIWALLKALVVDGMVHRRLYQLDLRRWAVHIAVFGSFLVLGILSTITGVVVEILPLLGMTPTEAASVPIIGPLYHADVWWVALLNEVLGLVVLGGMILVIYRRYVQKDPQLRTIPADSIIITLLALVAFSGFPSETFRLLADYTTPAGIFSPSPTMLPPAKYPPVLYDLWGPQWGFAGYVSALGLGALRFSPEVLGLVPQPFVLAAFRHRCRPAVPPAIQPLLPRDHEPRHRRLQYDGWSRRRTTSTCVTAGRCRTSPLGPRRQQA